MLSSLRLSVCNARALNSQPDEIFGRVSTPFWYLGHPLTSTEYGDRPRGIPSSSVGGGLNARGVAKYIDSGPIECYISETVQDEVS